MKAHRSMRECILVKHGIFRMFLFAVVFATIFFLQNISRSYSICLPSFHRLYQVNTLKIFDIGWRFFKSAVFALLIAQVKLNLD